MSSKNVQLVLQHCCKRVRKDVVHFTAHQSLLTCMQQYTLNVRSQGKQFCFPESPDVSRDEVEGKIRTLWKTKLTGFLRDLTLSVLLYF